MIFGRKKKPARKKTPKTLGQLLDNAFSNQLKKNPELLTEVALKQGAKKLGITFEKLDPSAEQKRNLKSRVVDQALRKIEEDPNLTERFVDSQIEEILGEGSGNGRYDDDIYPGSSLSQVLEDVDALEQLKEKLGGGSSSFASLFKDPAVATALLGLVQSIMGNNKIGPQEKLYIVNVDGQDRGISESEFRQLQSQGLLKPVAMIEAPHPTVEPDEEFPQPMIKKQILTEEHLSTEEEPDISTISGIFDINILTGYIELPPEEVVEQLSYDFDAGLEHAKFLWDFLSSANYDNVVQLIKPYESNTEVSYIIGKILSDEGKEWFEKVVELIKEKNQHG